MGKVGRTLYRRRATAKLSHHPVKLANDARLPRAQARRLDRSPDHARQRIWRRLPGGGRVTAHIVKVVHFADLHLDATFAWMGARDPESPRKRRQGLRATLRRIAQLTIDQKADALLCAGDLYEHEHFTPDTVEFVQSVFAELHPIPVFIAPGNHDWLGPESLYRQACWTPNVHVFNRDRLEPKQLSDGLTLWGGAHVVPANSDNFLDGFSVGRSGVHIALFHGSDQSTFFQQAQGKVPHAPFRPEQIVDAGLHHAFVGHFHSPADKPAHTYPGNPDPLNFGEEGERGAVVATIHPDGRVDRVRHRVASIEAVDITVDVTGCTSVDAVAHQVRMTVGGFRDVARITLVGALEPSVDLRMSDLHAAVEHLQGASFRLSKLQHAYDLTKLAEDRTVRGQFVKDVLAAGLPDSEMRLILATGLRALDGRADLGTV
jgi:DNA repair protein SbcD/Mre11